MEQEAAEELARGDGHAVAVLRGEADGVGSDGLKAVVGETHAVGVAAEVVEDLRGAAEGPLGVDDPLLAIELIEERAEGPRVGQVGDGPGELEFPALPGPRERGQELPAEEPGEYRVGRRAAVRASIQRAAASAWHLGQWRLRQEL